MKKTLSLLLFALLLAGALTLPAFAETLVAEKKQLPAAGSVCTSCGEGRIHPLTASTPWKLCSTLPCEESVWHNDGVLERQVSYYRYCDHCQALHAYTETESRTAHLHNKHYQQKLRNGTL
ncbi:MAG: hypothetical protein KH706_07035 [Faecalibacterium prausnitzii]|nr:hypothetical protein [Faecalibacterium prausnitzii]